MITADEISAIGHLGKPHGISGEINASLDIDTADIGALSCVVLDVDSIFVPFFIAGARGKGATGVILKIDGIDTDTQARELGGKTVFALRSEIDEELDEDSPEALIGYRICDRDGNEIGQVADIDDTTANLLFVLGNGLLIPVAEELITGIDRDARIINMQLPEGLIEAQS